MTKKEFLTHIQDALQREEELTPDMRLDTIEEWDSLAIVSLISLYDVHFRMSVTGNTLRECHKVSDLLAIVQDKLK